MRTVFTNGCFDLFHEGHQHLLEQCVALLGEHGVLVIAVNSDESVRQLKGKGRPVDHWLVRCSKVQAYCTHELGRLPQVIPFEGDVLPLIVAIRPAVMVKGDDWSKETVVGGDFLSSYGGELVIVPRTPGVSTTGLAERLA